mgnify:CR=1 FL=1
MEHRKLTSSQTTLTQLSRKESVRREVVRSTLPISHQDDTPIGHDVRRLLSVPMVGELTDVDESKVCVTPVGKMHTVDDEFQKGFKSELYKDTHSDDSDFEKKPSQKYKTRKKKRKRENASPHSPASDTLSVELLPSPLSKLKNTLSSQTIARQYNLLLDDKLRLKKQNTELEKVLGKNFQVVTKYEALEHKYKQACTEVRYLQYQLHIINLASKQQTYGQIDALDLSNYEGWIGPRPQD